VILILRFLARVLTFLLLVVLALAGLAIAVFCVQGGNGTLSPAGGADLVRLPDLRDEVAGLLATVEAGGSVAALTALCGAGAVLVGLGLIIGAAAPRRERLVTASKGGTGAPTAKRRVLANAAAALAEQSREVTSAKGRIRARRRGPGGVLRLKLEHTRLSDPSKLKERVETDLADLSEGFSLKVKLETKLAEGAGRVR